MTENISEEEVIERWGNQYFPQRLYIDEIPVGTGSGSSTKFIDVAIIENIPFNSQREYTQEVLAKNPTGFQKREQYTQYILERCVEPIPVRVFEAKRQLNFKSIGQILSYSNCLPEYYEQEIAILEKGIIYAEEDDMCKATAEEYDISLYPV